MLKPTDIERELDELGRRMSQRGSPVHELERLAIAFPGIEFRCRRSGHGCRVFSIERETARLIGVSAFDVLAECGRRYFGSVRSVHSRYAPGFQGRGIATAVYSWMLGQGYVLVSGARQSRAAYCLWRKLGRRHELDVVSVSARNVQPVAVSEGDVRFDDLDVRLRLKPCRSRPR